jgi:phage gp29-like protein
MPRRQKSLVKSRVQPPSSNGNGHAPSRTLIDSTVVKVLNNDRMLFNLWGELRPTELAGILKQAVIGNLVWQERLFQKMMDTWPRLQKNILSLKRDVANLDWSINAFSEKDEAPTDSAQEKAALVERALYGMVADPVTDTDDFSGMIKTLVDAVPCGFSISEITWIKRDGEIVPQCTKKTPARFYGYSLMPDKPDQLMLNPKGNLALTWEALEEFPANKFLIGVFKAYSNHPTMAPMLRSLTPWWFAHIYGLKWLMTFCQMFGAPFRWAEYTPGNDENADSVFNQLLSMLEQMGNAGYGVFPTGAKVNLLESKANNGSMLPQRVLVGDADEQCDIMILGQTLTSSSGRAGGNRALGEVHADTERKVLNGVADFVKTVINTQLIPAIIGLNYGETSELPTLEGSDDEEQDELAIAQRMLIIADQMQLPIAKEWLYEHFSIPQPADDADLYSPSGVGPDPAFKIPEPPPLPPLPPGAIPPPGGTAPNPDGVAAPHGPPGAQAQPPAKATASDAGTLVPSMQMALSVKRGLDLRKKTGRGGSLTAVTRARDISARKPMSVSTARRMQIYFDSNPDAGKAEPNSPAGIAYLLHGGNAGKAWCESVVKGQS